MRLAYAKGQMSRNLKIRTLIACTNIKRDMKSCAKIRDGPIKR